MSVDHAFEWCLNIALSNRFDLRKSSDKLVSRNKPHKACYWKCSRSGIYNPNPIRERKNTATIKCGCKFQIVAREVGLVGGADYGWIVLPNTQTGNHNHNLMLYDDGHRRASKLTANQKASIEYKIRAHMGAKNICEELHLENPLQAKLLRRTVYNMSSAMKIKEQGAMSSAQHMVDLANRAGYKLFAETDADDRLTHAFMAHPVSLLMYKIFHGVVLMDSTYSTNSYSFPLLQFVGRTPVGKSFVIAYVIFEGETEASYTWALRKFRSLLPDGILPNAIVTDRELGLMKALDAVFPDIKKLLCVWHVNKAVEKRCDTGHPGGYGKYVFATYWHHIVEALDRVELVNLWGDFIERTPKLVSKKKVHYLDKVWGDLYVKFVKGYTNEVRHFGNTATSSVESSHSVLKNWLDSPRRGLGTLWKRFHSMIEGQIRDIKHLLEKSRTSFLHDMNKRRYSMLKCNVTHEAVVLMEAEFERGIKLGRGLRYRCGHAIFHTHGLLCACRLHDLEAKNGMIQLGDIDEYWRTLTLDDRPVQNLSHLHNMLDKIPTLHEDRQKEVELVLHNYFHPEDFVMFSPHVKKNPKGRPPLPKGRKPSDWEHAAAKYSKRGKETSEPVRTDFDTVPNGPCEYNYETGSYMKFRSRKSMPELMMKEWLDGWYYTIGDGHCGFRAMSHARLGDEGFYLKMRTDVCNELAARYQLYTDVYGVDDWLEAHQRIPFPHQSSCGEDHWLDSYDFYAFATMWNWAIVVISGEDNRQMVRTWYGSQTYLPLLAPHGEIAPFGICVVVYTGKNHWLRLHMKPGFPMPPVGEVWKSHRRESVAHYENLYEEQFRAWEDNIL